MGRSKPVPLYKPQAKTAHIKRVPSNEPLPTYEVALTQPPIIHNAFSIQPAYHKGMGTDPWSVNLVEEQQYYGGAFFGANDQPMDIVYSVGDPGHVDYPMLSPSSSIDYMDVDLPEGFSMNVDDANEMDIDPASFYEDVIVIPLQPSPPQIIAQSMPTRLPRPERVVSMSEARIIHRIDPLRASQCSPSTIQRPVLSLIQNVPPKSDFSQAPNLPLQCYDLPVTQEIEGPPPAGTQFGLSPTDDLEQIIQGLLKLSLSDLTHPLTVEPNVTNLQAYPLSVGDTPPSTELITLNSDTLICLTSDNAKPTISTPLPDTPPALTGVWEDLAGLEDAFTSPNIVDAPTSLVCSSFRSVKSFTNLFDFPNADWEHAFDVVPYNQPTEIPLATSKPSPSRKYSPQKFKNLSKNASFRCQSQSIKSTVLGSTLEASQAARKIRFSVLVDNTKKSHNAATSDCLRKALAKHRFNLARFSAPLSTGVDTAVIVQEKPLVSYTDSYAQTDIRSSYVKVQETRASPKASPPLWTLTSAHPTPVRDTIIQKVMETYVWVDSALAISKLCPPEPPCKIVKTSVPIVTETPIPGAFPVIEDMSCGRGQNFFSWLSLRILGW